jgi:competence protein ComQ
MRQDVIGQIERWIDEYFPYAPLNAMLRQFSAEKQREGSTWSDIALTVHAMLGGRSSHIVKSAAAAELILLALDIVDDLQDQDNMRKPWMTAPQPLALNAVLSFLTLFISGLGEMLEPADGNRAGVVAAAGKLLAGSIYGQHLDITDAVETEEDYVEMVHHKSGLLMQLVCYLGYCLVEPAVDEATAAVMDELAQFAGGVSQLRNDLNDVQRVDVKNDLLNKKKTVPTLFLLKGSADEFPPLLDYYEGRLSREQFLDLKPDILRYVESSGCIEYTRAIQYLYLERADELLDKLQADDEWKMRFRDLTFGK